MKQLESLQVGKESGTIDLKFWSSRHLSRTVGQVFWFDYKDIQLGRNKRELGVETVGFSSKETCVTSIFGLPSSNLPDLQLNMHS